MCAILHHTICSLRIPPPQIILGAIIDRQQHLEETNVIADGFCLRILTCKVSSTDTLLIDKVSAGLKQEMIPWNKSEDRYNSE